MVVMIVVVVVAVVAVVVDDDDDDDVVLVLVEVADMEKIEEEHRLEQLMQQRLPFRGLHSDGFHCSSQNE